MVSSLRSLLGSAVNLTRLRSSTLYLLDRRSMYTSVHSLVHGDEGVIVLITIDLVHTLSHSAHGFILILILFIG